MLDNVRKKLEKNRKSEKMLEKIRKKLEQIRKCQNKI